MRREPGNTWGTRMGQFTYDLLKNKLLVCKNMKWYMTIYDQCKQLIFDYMYSKRL